MAEHHAAGDGKHKASTNAGGSAHGNSRPGAAGGGGGKVGLSGGLTQPAGWQSLLSFSILFLACLAGFSSRLFAVIRFESIIHEFDPCEKMCVLQLRAHGADWKWRSLPDTHTHNYCCCCRLDAVIDFSSAQSFTLSAANHYFK
uniref:STT3 oligosaccharyltransferase complex catalytic subunit B n=1 Tax=Gasterosteus aculeatus aculeatus TaxID=481459 RepID=A0AAQ4PYD5_GASAC